MLLDACERAGSERSNEVICNGSQNDPSGEVVPAEDGQADAVVGSVIDPAGA